MTFLTKTTLWASRWLGPPLIISVSVRSSFSMTRARSSDISDYALLSYPSGARLDLSAEDDAIALVLAECPALPYSELIKSGIPGPFEFEACSPCCLEALAFFFHTSLSCWAFHSHSHQGRALGSVGDTIPEASECEAEKLVLF